ncbi:hypothetical protein [Candidatus Protochlamydia phocaeensis]|uniref:hypothetical protein n=1 Tax=Candidatus Protochlamydia phocaeensis TaxID=1414722 RepID=UPI000838DFD3|nr:hypothetical protein [Candidatus Protochlamydia phocaeensis]
MFHHLYRTTITIVFTHFLFASGLVFTIDPLEPINLDGIKMHVIKTAENGVVNQETIFHFSQQEGMIFAEYQGGKIYKGFLVGKLSTPHQLEFSYCQLQLDGKLDNGISTCQLERNKEGKIILIEYFEWKSRPGEFGTNIFQEL